ncbi:MAG: tripartite tricarboxylate transporter TctB family protein [Planctomycetes bacterium]|nr:tripartite tricarboxylate transporter TctB family protein [Planctomycetota bacterium]
MSRCLYETLFAVACIGLGAVFWATTGELIPSAALFPKMVVGAVVFFSCWMLVLAYRNRRPEAAEAAEAEPPAGHRFHTGRLIGFFLLCVLYVGSIDVLGYFLATPLFIVLSYRFLRSVRLSTAIVAASVFTAVVYILFVRFLHIPLPPGICEPLLEAWL